jgi:ComF family protein
VKQILPAARRATSNLAPAWELFLDLIYPPRCGGCDKRGTLLCPECRRTIIGPGESALAVPEIDLLLYGGAFEGPLREAIHKFKYQGDTPLARWLAGLLTGRITRHLATTWRAGEPPVLVPVPLHAAKRRERGYNQAELLARHIAKETGVAIDFGLVRVKETRSQVGLSGPEREANVAGAFKWRHEKAPRTVILVDDVCTTGATLTECAAVLKLKGARSVCAVTVAKAISMGPDR